jgi:hypothetical protein
LQQVSVKEIFIFFLGITCRCFLHWQEQGGQDLTFQF